MTSYGHGPGYSTRPAYSTGPGYSTGPAYSTRPAYSTGPAYTTGSNGVRPYTNEWGQTRYVDTDDFRTTIVDADRTRSTTIAEPAGSYVTKHETIITERVDSPLLTSYRHGSPPSGNYGYPATGDNWSSRPSSPPRQAFEPARTYGGYPNQSGYNGPPGYGDYSDQYSTNKPYKHSNTSRYDNYDDHSHNRKHNGGAMGTAINMIANGSGHSAKPNRGSLLAAARPVRGDGRLSLPTDDMERALHYLKESSKPKDKYSYK